MRRFEVAHLASMREDAVEQVTADAVRTALADRVPAEVVEVGTQEPATYWRAGDRYFLDDPDFGPVVDCADLAYDSALGLHVRTA
jgi:hypothetical protein